MKKSIVLGLTATLLTFGPLVAGPKTPSKASKPVSSSSQTMQKQQPGTVSQSTTTTTQSTASTKSSKKASMASNRIHRERGTVDTVSSDQLSITTKSGHKDTFVLESSTKNASQAKAGDRVTVWYRESNGQKMATRIAVNQGGAAASKSSGSSMSASKNSGTTSSASNTKAKGQHSPTTAHH